MAAFAVILAVVAFTAIRSGSNGGSLVSIEAREDGDGDRYSHELDVEGDVLTTSGTVFVDIRGEVQHPGVFEIDINARVNDVVAMAGGLTDDAQDLAVNFAMRVYDEMRILVPSVNDVPTEDIISGMSPSADETHEASSSDDTNLVSINQASATELQVLPGIGPAISSAIVTHRDNNGPFSSIDSLTEVPGIGVATLANIRDLIRL